VFNPSSKNVRLRHSQPLLLRRQRRTGSGSHEYHSLRRKDGVGVCPGLSLPCPTWSTIEDCCAPYDGTASPMSLSSSATTAKKRSGKWRPTDASEHRPTVQCMQDGIFRTGPTAISCTMQFHGGDLEALLEYYWGGESATTGTKPGKCSPHSNTLADSRHSSIPMYFIGMIPCPA
jgi:hypothetical protein